MKMAYKNLSKEVVDQMGIYVRLQVLDQYIPNKEWAAVFDETLRLLKARDSIGPKREKVYFGRKSAIERIYYSRNIENDVDDPEKHHWHVVGDMKSLLMGESFILHRRIPPRKKTDDQPPEDEADILLELIREVESDASAQCRMPFNDKTQGYPYHYNILAAAMLIEDRFPRHAVVSGDIDRYQALKAKEIIREVLNKEVCLPVVTEWGALLDRILKYRSGLAAIEAFDRIVRDDRRRDGIERFRAIAERFDDGVIHQWIMRDLKEFNSPSQIGCLDIFIDCLNAGFDVKTLTELACLREEGPRFEPEKFVDALTGSLWLTVEIENRKQFDIFQKPKGDVDRVASQFGKALFEMMGAKGRDLQVYMPEAELMDALKPLFPEKIEQLRKIAADVRSEAMKNLETNKDYIMKLGSDDDDMRERNSLLDGTEFFELNEGDPMTESQTMMLIGIAALRKEIGEQLLKQEDAAKKILDPSDTDKSLIFLTKILSDRGPRLTEDAWGWIDREKEFEMIKTLCLLALMNEHEQKIWNTKKSIFEKRWLCKMVTDWSRDEEKMAYFKRKFEEESPESFSR